MGDDVHDEDADADDDDDDDDGDDIDDVDGNDSAPGVTSRPSNILCPLAVCRSSVVMLVPTTTAAE